MNVSVDGQTVEIELETPLANVISFEHAPETEAQKQEVRVMAAMRAYRMSLADGLAVST